MAEYIYRINPDLTTIQRIFDTDGIVIWDIACAKDRLHSGDTLYIYICSPQNIPNPKDRIFFCETETVAYVATVLEVLDSFKIPDQNTRCQVKLKLSALSYHAVQRIKELQLTQNGYSSRTPLTGLSENSSLGKSIKTALIRKPEDIIPVTPESYDDKIINEYNTVTQLIERRIHKKNDKKKLHGNITASIFIKYMQRVIDSAELPYKVSPSNSFVDGYGIEWDAVIVRKDALNIMNLNIFEPSKTVAVVEFKTSGLIRSIADFEAPDSPILKNAINSFKSLSAEHEEMKLGYISLEEREPESNAFKYFTKTCEVINRKIPKDKFSCYNFINTAKKKQKYDNNCTWTEFVLSLLP